MSMTKKKITLEDGRYLIYFTFGKDNEEKQPEKSEEKSCGCGCKCCGGGK